MRTAFSTVVRESQDLACGVFDTRGEHDGPVAHRHARPHQRDGHRRAPLPGRLPARDARAGRRADHQRPVDDGRPDQRHDRRHAGLPRRPRGRLLRQHLPRAPTSAGAILSAEAREVYEEGLRIPITKLVRPRRAERDAVRDHPRQRAHAGRDDRRPVRADGLQRRRRARLLRVHGRVRPGQHRAAVGRDHRALRAGACARRSARCPDGDVRRTRSGATASTSPMHIEVRGDRRRRRRCASTTPARRRRAVAASTWSSTTPTPTPSFAIKAAISPEVPHNEGAFRPVHVDARRRARS